MNYVVRAAGAKASGVLPLLPELSFARGRGKEKPAGAPLIIAADTIVVLDDIVLGKPKDAEQAFVMLSSLAGRMHRVLSGCVLMRALPMNRAKHSFRPAPSGQLPSSGMDVFCFVVESRVHMWDCPKSLLRAYAQSGEPLDKAGAYAVQGAGAFLVERLEGSWSNVVGLPLAELIRALLCMGVLQGCD